MAKQSIAFNKSLVNFWSISQQDAITALDSSISGLSDEVALERLQQLGPNSIKPSSKSSSFILFLSQFKSPITLLLIAAALLSMGLRDFSDAIVILIITVISGSLGFWQEKGAETAVEQLLKMVLKIHSSFFHH